MTTADEALLTELRAWAYEPVPTAVPWVRDRVRLLLALADDLRRVVSDLEQESDAARLALRYRGALERIVQVESEWPGDSRPVTDLEHVIWVAREALEDAP